MSPISKNTVFDCYWVSYLGSHTNAKNRMCHYLGTVLGILGGVLGFVFINIYAGFLIGIMGYSVALLGHFAFQKNSPHATKLHLGLLCGFLMLFLYIFNREKLNKQLARVDVKK